VDSAAKSPVEKAISAINSAVFFMGGREGEGLHALWRLRDGDGK